LARLAPESELVRILNYPRLLAVIGLCGLANLAGLSVDIGNLSFISFALAPVCAFGGTGKKPLSHSLAVSDQITLLRLILIKALLALDYAGRSSSRVISSDSVRTLTTHFACA
jgi:hypothetical protein